MANTLGASAGGISSAINNIRQKKDDLETQANAISAAFTNLTETVQLQWLNRVISESWNATGNAAVENAKVTMENLMKDLNTIQETAETISQG